MTKIYFLLCVSFLLSIPQLFTQNTNTPSFLLTNDFGRFEVPPNTSSSQIEICGFEKNQMYDIWIGGAKSDLLATKECAFISIKKASNSWVSVSKKEYTADNSSATKSIANIQTDDSYNQYDLVSDIFIGGDCFEVDNVEIIGNSLGVGYFSQGTESIGIEDGIILATGNISNASGPNDSSSAGSALAGTNTDPDLEDLATSSVNDAVGIEFDFTPTNEMIEFQYVFASEEYCEYVNTAYNDVFGFFISGPGINGSFSLNGENIALVPNTTDFVAINTINHFNNWPLFVPNNINCGIDPAHPLTIQYDGATAVLTAIAQVIPCETYHIRMVVGDINDALYDSAVFLKANSFSAGGGADVAANSPFTGNNTVYEGCENGEFIFTRDNEDISEDLEIEFFLSNLSGAIAGEDYVDFPTTITIPAGQMTYTLNVEVIVDNVTEGNESIIIEVPASCSCSESMIEMVIIDVEPLSIEPQNPTTCATESVTLSATTLGGMPDYIYLWSTGETSQNITITPEGIGIETYAITVTDECGNQTFSQSTVNAVAPPEAIISGQGTHCLEDDATFIEFPIELTGAGPWELSYRFNGALQAPITVTSSPYFLAVNGVGTYTLDAVSHAAGYCPGYVSGLAEIAPATPPEANISGQGSLCPDEVTNYIDLPIELTGTGPWEIIYSLNSQPQPMITATTSPFYLPVNAIGSYTLESVSFIGGLCQGDVFGSAEITETVLSLIDETTPTECPDDNTGSISLTGSGGTQPYTFAWENTALNGANAQNLYAGNYPVTMYDAYGCQIEMVTLVEQPPRLVATPMKIEGLCEGDLGSIEFMDVQGGTPSYLFSIDGGEAFSSNTLYTQLIGGDYELVIQDTNGCEWEEELKIIDPEIIELYAETNEIIALGETYQIDVQTNIPNSEITDVVWTNTETLDCEDCLSPIASPYNTTDYRITITTDKGCVETTALVVRVDKSDLPVFVPTAFSPNADGINDTFTVFASDNAVTIIKKLEIYSRWGDRVFMREDFQPNDPDFGWDGVHRGKPLNNGVFLWYAEVEFIDGNTEMYKGDISLLK